MGSGHFLVGLVDYLADRVISVMAEAEAMVDGYASPLTNRIDDVRRTIVDNASLSGWTLDRDRLDDRHIVRRIVLKRCVYGVDRNPMAVELAKVSRNRLPHAGAYATGLGVAVRVRRWANVSEAAPRSRRGDCAGVGRRCG